MIVPAIVPGVAFDFEVARFSLAVGVPSIAWEGACCGRDERVRGTE